VRPSLPLPLRTAALVRLLHALGRFDVARMDADRIRRTREADLPAALLPLSLGRRARGVHVHDRAVAGVPVRVYRGAGARGAAPLVVNAHGGGWVLGNLQQNDWACSHLAARLGAVVVSVDYRLAPEHPAPAGLDDCWTVLAHLARDASDVGADAARVAVTGDSAGGNIAALLAIRHRDALRVGGEGAPAAPLRHQVLVYPAVDLTLSSPSIAARPHAPVLPRANIDRFLAHYLDGSDLAPDDPAVSPLLCTDLSDVAPALVLTADNDPLEDDGERYADALRAAGVPVRYSRYERVPHGFFSLPGFAPAAHHALAEVVQELARALD
jgi:acetyl esterase/lipase